MNNNIKQIIDTSFIAIVTVAVVFGTVSVIGMSIAYFIVKNKL